MLAGIIIGIAALTYLSVDNSIVGSFLFSFGLVTILINGLKLYTGRIGSIDSFKQLPKLLFILLENFVGAAGLGFLLHYTGVNPSTQTAAVALCANKVAKPLYETFILASGCGVMMELAVSSYAKSQNIFIVMLCVMVFILCGFEHSVANMFYFAFSGYIPFTYLVMQILGNSVGAILTRKALLWKY